MRKFVAFVSILFALTACEGPEGPMGPAGPAGAQGEAGEPGPGTRITFTGVINSQGRAEVILPTEAGTMADPPSLTCWTGNDGNVWLKVADGWNTNSPFCGLVEQRGGQLAAVMSRGLSGWRYLFVVVY